MVQFKLILSDPKTGMSEVHELKESNAQLLVGRKIGEAVDGPPMGLSGRMIITGGSDKAGFPMRRDVQGAGKKYVLLTRGVGLKTEVEGGKKRRLVRGNTISEEIYQVNARMATDSPKSA